MITSTQNEQLKKIRKILTSRKERETTGRYVVEGPRMMAEVPNDDLEKVYVAASYVPEWKRETDCAVEVVADNVFAKISDTKTPQGILGIVRKREHTRTGEGCMLLLDQIQDPGNLGTILRSAEAAGASAVILGPNCVDVYSPKVVRSSMGSIFRVPIEASRDMEETIGRLRKEGTKIYAAALEGASMMHEVALDQNCGILIGNEGQGLSPEIVRACDGAIRIPMEGKVESLNAAMAATVLLYEAHRQRQQSEATE